jgi:hypothetical protein
MLATILLPEHLPPNRWLFFPENARSLTLFGGGFTAAIWTLILAVRIKGRNEPFVVLPHYKVARHSIPGEVQSNLYKLRGK